MNKDLSDKEIEDFSNLTNKVLAEICRISDAHNIDRDSALKYFADMLTDFTEVATIQNYDSKQTNADRMQTVTNLSLKNAMEAQLKLMVTDLTIRNCWRSSHASTQS